MTYTLAQASRETTGAAMRRPLTEKENEDFVNDVMRDLIPKIFPIIPPANMSPAEQRGYVAYIEAGLKPDPEYADFIESLKPKPPKKEQSKIAAFLSLFI